MLSTLFSSEGKILLKKVGSEPGRAQEKNWKKYLQIRQNK